MINKVAVGKEGGIDKREEYDLHTFVRCNVCNIKLDHENPLLKPIIDFIVKAYSASEASKIAEWECEYKECKHVKELVQKPMDNFKPLDPVNIKCDDCDLKNNLWFCLECGHMGCGRKFFDNTGGNNHAVDHEKTTKHPVVVKMGTITPEGKACIVYIE